MPILESAGKSLFAKHISHYTPQDPLYETYTDNRGRTKRRKRELPPGLTAKEEQILRSVKRRAHHLDKGFSFCGLRFGWTFIIGIIPGAGDAADAMLGYFLVIRKARNADIPAWLTQRMLLNLAVGTSVGLVPIAGDVLLAVWRANSRNAHLLEEFLRVRGETALAEQAKTADTTALERPAKGKGRVGKAGAAGDVEVVGKADPGDEPSPSSSGKSRRSWGWGKKKSEGKEVPAPGGSEPVHLGDVGKRDSRFVEEMGR